MLLRIYENIFILYTAKIPNVYCINSAERKLFVEAALPKDPKDL